MERTIANPIPRLIPRTTKPGSWSGRLCWSYGVPPAGFEPALPPPEGGALSPELRGPCNWRRVAEARDVPPEGYAPPLLTPLRLRVQPLQQSLQPLHLVALGRLHALRQRAHLVVV